MKRTKPHPWGKEDFDRSVFLIPDCVDYNKRDEWNFEADVLASQWRLTWPATAPYAETLWGSSLPLQRAKLERKPSTGSAPSVVTRSAGSSFGANQPSPQAVQAVSGRWLLALA